jgi:hypothetical protein
MKTIIHYIHQYFYEVDKTILRLVSFFTAILIFLNYHFDIDKNISNDPVYFQDDYIDVDSGKLKASTPNCYADDGTTTYRKIGG